LACTFFFDAARTFVVREADLVRLLFGEGIRRPRTGDDHPNACPPGRAFERTSIRIDRRARDEVIHGRDALTLLHALVPHPSRDRIAQRIEAGHVSRSRGTVAEVSRTARLAGPLRGADPGFHIRRGVLTRSHDTDSHLRAIADADERTAEGCLPRAEQL